MFRRSRSVLLIFLLSLPAGLSAQVRPNKKAQRAVEAAGVVTREQDGLAGPVRRVRTVTARLTLRSGGPAEGPRKLLSVAVYDRAGRKVDGESYVTDDAPPPGSREAYKYDERGNVVEMKILDAGGSLVGQEVYSYEFDDVGNWTVMKTSAAVVEGGKLSYEPVEVTYRTITYYLTDTVARGLRGAEEKKAAAPTPTRAAPATETGAETASKKGEADSVVAPTAGRAAPAEAARLTSAAGAPIAADAPPVASNDASSAKPKVPEAASAVMTEGGGASTTPAAPKLVKEASGDLLRRAATFIPEPEHPAGAALADAAGSVEVRVIINERGEVTSARALSGHPLLTEAAEQAARRARFSPERLTDEPAEVFGVLTIEFARPASAASAPARSVPAPAHANSTPAVVNASTPAGEKMSAEAGALGGARAEPTAEAAVPTTTSSTGLSAAEYLKTGTGLLEAGRHKDAIKLLKSASRLDATNHQIFYSLGDAYWRAGLYKEASEAFQKVVEINPGHADAHYSLGNSFYSYGRHRQAIRAFQQAISLKPGVAQYHFGLGAAHLAAKEPATARKQVRILKDLNPALAVRLSEAIKAYEVFGDLHTGNIIERLGR
jgi:TonB family protein